MPPNKEEAKLYTASVEARSPSFLSAWGRSYSFFGLWNSGVHGPRLVADHDHLNVVFSNVCLLQETTLEATRQ